MQIEAPPSVENVETPLSEFEKTALAEFGEVIGEETYAIIASRASSLAAHKLGIERHNETDIHTPSKDIDIVTTPSGFERVVNWVQEMKAKGKVKGLDIDYKIDNSPEIRANHNGPDALRLLVTLKHANETVTLDLWNTVSPEGVLMSDISLLLSEGNVFEYEIPDRGSVRVLNPQGNIKLYEKVIGNEERIHGNNPSSRRHNSIHNLKGLTQQGL